MSQSRKHLSPDQKAHVVRRHLIGKEAVSDLADEFGVQPSQIHHWVTQVLDQAERAFQQTLGRPPRAEKLKERTIERLRAKLVQKNEVIAELMEERLKLTAAADS